MYELLNMVLALTARGRWAATRRLNPQTPLPSWFVPVGVAVMLVLLVVLVAISYRRRRQHQTPKPENFNDHALRRGLSARERQILLAIAMRSGLPHTYEIFHEPEGRGRCPGCR